VGLLDDEDNYCGFASMDTPKVPFCNLDKYGEYKTRCETIDKLEEVLDDENNELVNCGCCSYANEGKIPAYCPDYVKSAKRRGRFRM
jgi:hypothetical protein